MCAFITLLCSNTVLKNSLNKTEAALFLMHAMISRPIPFASLYQNLVLQLLYFLLDIC